MPTELQLKKAAEEMIRVMKLRDDDGTPLKLSPKMKAADYSEIIKNAIPLLEEGDTFEISTKRVINSFDITWYPEVLELKDTPDDELENPLPSLEQEVAEATTLRELKTIAQSEPEFKSIKGKLSSFTTVDQLKDEMLWLLSDDKTPMTEQDLPFKEEEKKETIEKTVSSTEMRNTIDISVRTPFNKLFDIKPEVLSAVIKSMETTGYDFAFPIVTWEDVCIDGHTRLIAAKTLGIKEVPVENKSFADEKEALEYAVHNQRDRRNLSDAELFRIISAFDEPVPKKEAAKEGGRSRTKKQKTELSVKSTAEKLKVPQRKVQDVRTVLSDETATKEVETGKKTIAKAAKDVRKKKNPSKINQEKVKKQTPVELLQEAVLLFQEITSEFAKNGNINEFLYHDCLDFLDKIEKR